MLYIGAAYLQVPASLELLEFTTLCSGVKKSFVEASAGVTGLRCGWPEGRGGYSEGRAGSSGCEVQQVLQDREDSVLPFACGEE